MNERFVGDLFGVPPVQWGLRGDPHLWDEMALMLCNVPMPLTVAELEALLLATFRKLTGADPQTGKNIFVERYPKIGISGGMVCSEFWLNRGFAIISGRYVDMSTGMD